MSQNYPYSRVHRGPFSGENPDRFVAYRFMSVVERA